MTPSPDLAADIEKGGLAYAVDGPVVTVMLDRPEVRNAQTPATWRALAAIGAQLPDDVRVVVLGGEGQSFSAGLDRRMLEPGGIEGEVSFAEMTTLDRDGFSAIVDDYQQGFTWLRDPRIVSVAAVQGYAIGAGLQLALACDLRVLADDAQLSMKETTLGLVPDLTGTKPLVEAVGYSRALEICATGRMVGAAEAQRLGLATAVVPRDDLEGTVADLVAAVLAAPAGALRDTKALLLSAVDSTLDEQRRAEREAQHGRFQQLGG
ncbi:enoyl-CoA hydratase/isomerase family protein [Nocardioides bigeumensis]|uniref:Enoyl-CoA hydratase/isomerase family protein n=1 Tax=Nocardioides bigeumensis TaxID=433657 RepID=A0ABP5JLF1_9ACTN